MKSMGSSMSVLATCSIPRGPSMRFGPGAAKDISLGDDQTANGSSKQTA